AAVMSEAGNADIFIAVAAVADWHVANARNSKLKKTGDSQPPALEFSINPDILADVAHMAAGPYCAGFAAETENLQENAEAKRQRKGVPLLVGNLAQQAMNADTTELVLFDAQGARTLPKQPKLGAARQLVREIADRAPRSSDHACP